MIWFGCLWRRIDYFIKSIILIDTVRIVLCCDYLGVAMLSLRHGCCVPRRRHSLSFQQLVIARCLGVCYLPFCMDPEGFVNARAVMQVLLGVPASPFGYVDLSFSAFALFPKYDDRRASSDRVIRDFWFKSQTAARLRLFSPPALLDGLLRAIMSPHGRHRAAIPVSRRAYLQCKSRFSEVMLAVLFVIPMLLLSVVHFVVTFVTMVPAILVRLPTIVQWSRRTITTPRVSSGFSGVSRIADFNLGSRIMDAGIGIAMEGMILGASSYALCTVLELDRSSLRFVLAAIFVLVTCSAIESCFRSVKLRRAMHDLRVKYNCHVVREEKVASDAAAQQSKLLAEESSSLASLGWVQHKYHQVKDTVTARVKARKGDGGDAPRSGGDDILPERPVAQVGRYPLPLHVAPGQPDPQMTSSDIAEAINFCAEGWMMGGFFSGGWFSGGFYGDMTPFGFLRDVTLLLGNVIAFITALFLDCVLLRDGKKLTLGEASRTPAPMEWHYLSNPINCSGLNR